MTKRYKEKDYNEIKKYFRGDSAFCSSGIMNACTNAGMKYVVCMKANMYNPLIKNITNWSEIDNTGREKKDKFYFKGDRACEVGETIYFTDEMQRFARVVILRALKVDKQNSIFSEDNYDYFAVATTIESSSMDAEKLIRFYRKRGNAENFIKEMKGGFDLRHYPCQKLLANRAYGLIGAFAYNFMRYAAFLLNPKKVPYAKRVRFLIVYLPCMVIKHARQVIFRFNEKIYREVMRYKQKLHKSLNLVFEN